MSDISTKIVELLAYCYVIPGMTNVGIITDKKPMSCDVYIIDSGCTEIDGEYILNILETLFEQKGQKFKVKAIINTHGHTDHSGGNNFIQKKTGCEVWISRFEQPYIENPVMQATDIWGGTPPHEIQTAYFKQQPSEATRNIGEEDFIRLSGKRSISFLTLPGHSFGMTAVIYTDENGRKAIFAGDGIFTRDELSKHWIPYMANPMEFMRSLEKLASLGDIEWCIPGHGYFIRRNLSETIEMNTLAILETKQLLLNLISKGRKTTDELLKEVADINELKLGFGQSVLIRSTLKSYLASMHDQGLIKVVIEDNIFYWCEG